MDYNYLANQILLMFQAGRPTVEGADVREIAAWVQQAHADVGRNEYFENYKADNQSTVNGQWLVNYELYLNDPIVNPDITGYRKVTLLENYIALPRNRGVVRVAIGDPDYKGRKQLSYIGFDNYEHIKGGETIKFAAKYFYSVVSKTIYVLPACNEPIKFTKLIVTTAVANDATINDSHTMLIVSRVMPLMQQRFGRKADMVTDANPNAS